MQFNFTASFIWINYVFFFQLLSMPSIQKFLFLIFVQMYIVFI